MELKYIVSGSLAGIGAAILLYGFLNANTSYINLGIAGIFLSAVILTIKSSEYIKKDAALRILKPYIGLFEKFVDNLSLEGNAVYIPPYQNLPEGGVFIPLKENFEIDLGRLDEKTVFLTDVPKENQMGILLMPLGAELLKKYEEHLEYPLSNTSYAEVESVAGAVLRTLGLAKSVYIEEQENSFRVVIQPEFKCEKLDVCEKVGCPICSSVLLGLAKATNQLIYVESFEKKDYGIEIKAKKLGGVREWR
ncbi:MAG: hypothetical protein H0Z18_07205 [Thermococcus sp.]|uniref:hypothetical protein n=1 Tax=Thermococcus sp. TaxID=35749 RepID=UPI001D61E7E8|nr:hypothetical protein [Thermococcus sp.]MBO8175029.1 hypothetical protein [Thermococcus sp.]